MTGSRHIRRRLDAEMVRRGIVASREQARRLIVDRQVLVDGSYADKPARMVDPAQSIQLIKAPPPFVSRAGQKLDDALGRFGLDPAGFRCLDIGSSTGGFTDCLLQRGAHSVVSVDVGTHQMHERIRADPRVEVREQTDARSLRPEMFERLFDLVVADLSFISLRLVLPAAVALVRPGRSLVVLVKPQFEAGREEASRGQGIISDPAIWRRVLVEVIDEAQRSGAGLKALVPSGLPGSKGNVEFMVWLERGASTISGREAAIDAAVAAAADLGPERPGGREGRSSGNHRKGSERTGSELP